MHCDYSHSIPGYDAWKLAYPPHWDLEDEDDSEEEDLEEEYPDEDLEEE